MQLRWAHSSFSRPSGAKIAAAGPGSTKWRAKKAPLVLTICVFSLIFDAHSDAQRRIQVGLEDVIRNRPPPAALGADDAVVKEAGSGSAAGACT